MDVAANILAGVQFFFAVVIGLYFWNLLRTQQGSRAAVERESRKEMERLRRLRSVALTEPLAEKARPTRLDEIVGQEDGIRALRAALCGPHPQHVIIYGPPGVGKTAAARLVLEEAKRNPLSPFREHARLVELDATTARFDERGIADPLIGSVHDPIYQGAGPLGVAGIPQPKPGAVTKAHGGVLFIDEIGELHPIQMNKLLKVLEDRKVFFESAYYSSEDPNIPTHIQDVFENGLPADFRLVGATTRSPEELPPAIRSRCVEIFFRPLRPDEVERIVRGAAERISMPVEEEAVKLVGKYAQNGREAVNIVQIAAGVVQTEGRGCITAADVEWVLQCGQHVPRPEFSIPTEPQVGLVAGLAVLGPGQGAVLELEVTAQFVGGRRGELVVTGAVTEEELGGSGHRVRRKSMAYCSVESVVTVVKKRLGVDTRDYDIHVNFPGSVPVDGPSAGVAIATALVSALLGQPVQPRVAMTGELSIRGKVHPVGGVLAKVEAARLAGAEKVLIPRANWQGMFARFPLQVVPVASLDEVLREALGPVSLPRPSCDSVPGVSRPAS